MTDEEILRWYSRGYADKSLGYEFREIAKKAHKPGLQDFTGGITRSDDEILKLIQE